jgi:uncharacterized lipoprotein YajG
MKYHTTMATLVSAVLFAACSAPSSDITPNNAGQSAIISQTDIAEDAADWGSFSLISRKIHMS